MQVLEAIAFQKASDGRLTSLKNAQVAQRAIQPAGQQSRAHRGLAAVHDRLQRVIAATGQIGVQLQVATAGGIKDHRVVEALVTQAAQMRQGSALGFFRVTEQTAGSTNGQCQGFAAKAFQVLG